MMHPFAAGLSRADLLHLVVECPEEFNRLARAERHDVLRRLGIFTLDNEEWFA